MSELIYVLTVMFFVYVVEEIEGDRLVVFMKNVLNIDLSQLHSAYKSLHERLFNSISFNKVSFA